MPHGTIEFNPFTKKLMIKGSEGKFYQLPNGHSLKLNDAVKFKVAQPPSKTASDLCAVKVEKIKPAPAPRVSAAGFAAGAAAAPHQPTPKPAAAPSAAAAAAKALAPQPSVGGAAAAAAQNPRPQPAPAAAADGAAAASAKNDEGWSDVKSSARNRAVRKEAAAAQPWTLNELAEAIADEALSMMDKSFHYDGPALRISDVYKDFNLFTSKELIVAVQKYLDTLDPPSKRFKKPSLRPSSRYSAATSKGKGKDFNIKVQTRKEIEGEGKARYRADAQIHVKWN